MNIFDFFENVAENGSKFGNVNIEIEKDGKLSLLPIVVTVVDDDVNSQFIRVAESEKHIYNQIRAAADNAGFDVLVFLISFGQIVVEVQ